MVKPTDGLEWATDGGAEITEPSAGYKAAGWVAGDPAPSHYMNWWMNNNEAWRDYFETTTDDHESRIATMEPVVTANAIAVTDHETRIGDLETDVADHEIRIVAMEPEVADWTAFRQSLYPSDVINEASTGSLVAPSGYTALDSEFFVVVDSGNATTASFKVYRIDSRTGTFSLVGTTAASSITHLNALGSNYINLSITAIGPTTILISAVWDANGTYVVKATVNTGTGAITSTGSSSLGVNPSSNDTMQLCALTATSVIVYFNDTAASNIVLWAIEESGGTWSVTDTHSIAKLGAQGSIVRYTDTKFLFSQYTGAANTHRFYGGEFTSDIISVVGATDDIASSGGGFGVYVGNNYFLLQNTSASPYKHRIYYWDPNDDERTFVVNTTGTTTLASSYLYMGGRILNLGGATWYSNIVEWNNRVQLSVADMPPF